MMGAGILPVALHNNEIFFLFAREGIINSVQPGLWSDFGGSTERGETKLRTAIREGWEESNGIFGNIHDVAYIVKNKAVKIIDIGTYRTYIVPIDYDKHIPRYFSDDYKYTLTNHPRFVKASNGMYEKDKVQWVPLSKLKRNPSMIKFRPWYVQIIKTLLRSSRV